MPIEQRENYVNNKEFSAAVGEYVAQLRLSKSDGKEPPRISEYIGSCFIKIAQGVAKRPNFSRYTYRDEMVSDAIENCIRAIHNYKENATTRSGSPNAFAYFTQISWYAFLRRINLEKRQQDIKEKLIYSSSVDEYATFGADGSSADESLIERARVKGDRFSDREETPAPKKKPGRKKVVTSTLAEFIK